MADFVSLTVVLPQFIFLQLLIKAFKLVFKGSELIFIVFPFLVHAFFYVFNGNLEGLKFLLSLSLHFLYSLLQIFILISQRLIVLFELVVRVFKLLMR